MRLGIIFPVIIFISAVVFLSWFLLAVTLRLEHNDEKNNAYYDWRGYHRGSGHGTGVVVTKEKGHLSVASIVFMFT